MKTIKPQKGFQEQFLSSPADIVIGGGAAGVGKSYALLLEAMRHISNPGYSATIFRRTTKQVRTGGGLWDTSTNLYQYIEGIEMKDSILKHQFPSGATVNFSHLEHEKNIYDYQGAQIPFIGFDELTHFTAKMFFYLLSRNRSVCGVKPYIRATCNPEPLSWVARLLEWWIDQNTGFPIPERAGVIRYFTVYKNAYVWGNTAQEVIDQVPSYRNKSETMDSKLKDLIKTLTFIPGKITDNQELLNVNPEYLANLLMQDEAERLKLLEGNWKVTVDGMEIFKYHKLQDLHTNYLVDNDTKIRRVTFDAARFGSDLAAVMTFIGYSCVRLSILTTSKTTDIYDTIELDRGTYGVATSDVVGDQDGVGGGVVDQGGYRGFYNGGKTQPHPESGVKENYKNFKTQCYYWLGNFVNEGRLTFKDVEIFIDGVRTDILEKNNQKFNVRDMIVEDLFAIKRANTDKEGKKEIIPKEEQKTILGRSPDLGDCLMMLMYFEFQHRSSGSDMTGSITYEDKAESFYEPVYSDETSSVDFY